MGKPLQLHGIVSKDASTKPAAPAHRRVAFETFEALISDYALTTDTAEIPPEILSAAAMTHHRILLAYCADHGLLPIRFGTVFSGSSAMKNAVLENVHLYETALHILSDHREYSVHLNIRQAPTEELHTPKSGRAFLSERQRGRDKRRSLAQKRQSFARCVQDNVAALAFDALRTAAPKPEKVLDVTGLFSPKALDELQWLASSLQSEALELDLSLTINGPWPAYHFDPRLFDQGAATDVA